MPSRGWRLWRSARARLVPASFLSPKFRIRVLGSDDEQGQTMPSLRSQLSAESDSAAPDAEDNRVIEALKDRAAAPVDVADAEPKRTTTILFLSAFLAALWAGAASAYLAGFFRTQAVSFSWELIGFIVIIAFLPPLLIIAAGFTLSRAQAMNQTAQR